MKLSLSRRNLFFVLVFFAITPLVLWGTYKLAERKAIAELESHVQGGLLLYVRSLQTRLTGYEHLAGTLASAMPVVNLLRNPESPAWVRMANRYLKATNEAVHASTIYILAPDGRTLAASDWGSESTSVGENYGFRDYFREAIGGRTGRAVAMGKTSDTLGYYLAKPVIAGADILGVAVVKVSLDETSMLFADLDMHFYTADKDGVIFLASKDDWRFQTIRPLTGRLKSSVLEEQRYPEQLLSHWPARKTRNWNKVSHFIVEPDGQEYLSQASLLLTQGWEVHALGSIAPVEREVRFALVVGMLACAFTLLLALFLMQRRDYLRELRSAAIRDSLTGLFTRRYMHDTAIAHLTRIERGQTDGMAAAMLDIDRFKRINDRYGHRVGDQVLQAVGEAIRSQIRRGDIPVRYGGEEFSVIFNLKHGQDAGLCLQRILIAIRALEFKDTAPELQVTASGGIAHYREGETLEALLGRADELLYRAKHDGRDRFYDDRSPRQARKAGRKM